MDMLDASCLYLLDISNIGHHRILSAFLVNYRLELSHTCLFTIFILTCQPIKEAVEFNIGEEIKGWAEETEWLKHGHKHLVIWEDRACDDYLLRLLFLTVDSPSIELEWVSDQLVACGYHEGLLVLLCRGPRVGGGHDAGGDFKIILIELSLKSIKCLE